LNTTQVLGIKVACVDLQEILGIVGEWSLGSEHKSILYVNVHSINTAYANADLQAIFNQADLVYSDGIGVVLGSRLLGGCRLQKITGADWIYEYCEFAQKKGLRTYILAGEPGVGETARQNLLRKYPELNIVGVADGYFRVKSQASVLDEIRDSGAQIVFVGMGTPLQERWLYEYRAQIDAPICWCVGALFDYVAQVEPRVPAWMNALALEWLWRLIIDPKGKWKRYLIGNPLFIFRIFRESLSR
jgi:N-acetylglucosaminyldiphosphoundecaprenol N-acetyl-beta-D-mannosaminyltransferase